MKIIFVSVVAIAVASLRRLQSSWLIQRRPPVMKPSLLKPSVLLLLHNAQQIANVPDAVILMQLVLSLLLQLLPMLLYTDAAHAVTVVVVVVVVVAHDPMPLY